MSKQNKKAVAKQTAPVAKKSSLNIPVLTGTLTKNEDEESEIDWIGNVHVDKPGEYYVDAFMKKDESGNVYAELKLNMKEENQQPKNTLLDDRGVLFKNNRKRRKQQPDFTGNIRVSTPGEFSLEGSVKTKGENTYLELIIVDENSGDFIAEEDKLF